MFLRGGIQIQCPENAAAQHRHRLLLQGSGSQSAQLSILRRRRKQLQRSTMPCGAPGKYQARIRPGTSLHQHQQIPRSRTAEKFPLIVKPPLAAARALCTARPGIVKREALLSWRHIRIIPKITPLERAAQLFLRVKKLPPRSAAMQFMLV